jgi:mevalonate pyrophosphate decarboxylase
VQRLEELVSVGSTSSSDNNTTTGEGSSSSSARQVEAAVAALNLCLADYDSLQARLLEDGSVRAAFDGVMKEAGAGVEGI